MKPRVTFLVPCYKLAHLLRECVDSILAQSHGRNAKHPGSVRATVHQYLLHWWLIQDRAGIISIFDEVAGHPEYRVAEMAVLTSLNLVVRGRNRAWANNRPACAMHKHCTSLDGAGSGCVPFFAASC